MELYISDHPLDCLTCSANGDCELQDVAGAVGLRRVRYGYEGENHVFAKGKRWRGQRALSRQGRPTPISPTTRPNASSAIRCVRACEEVQGTFALTIDGRGFDSRVAAGQRRFPRLRMRLLRRLRAGLPDRDADGEPGHRAWPARAFSKVTTCAYCGVGCSFKAEMQGDQGHPHGAGTRTARRMRGHSCVEGRFALGYATHKDRITKPMIRGPRSPIPGVRSPGRRRSPTPLRSSSASRPSMAAASLGGITSSRCTNEEVFLVQKLVRAGFRNNNVDTCARVCHSPTGYGLGPDARHLGRHAGLRKRSRKADVILVIGANPTDGHPVFASRMKKPASARARA